MKNPEDHVLVVMPVAWMNFYAHGKYYNYTFIGTGTGWAKKYLDEKQPRGDTASMSIMTNRYLPASMVLRETYWGLAPHDKDPVPAKGQELTYEDVNDSGWDMFIIELPPSSDIHTYDEPEGSPGKPQNNDPPRNGEFDIVKCYRTFNEKTGTYTDDGTTYRIGCTKNIIVEDEPEYKVVEWDTARTTDITLSSINFIPPGQMRHSETTGKVEMDKTGQT